MTTTLEPAPSLTTFLRELLTKREDCEEQDLQLTETGIVILSREDHFSELAQ